MNLLTSLLALSVSLAILRPAVACTCEPVDPPTVAEISAASRSGLAYIGSVQAEDSTSHEEFRRYTIEVVSTLAGEPRETRTVATGKHDGTCGIRLQIGRTYLLLPFITGSSVESAGAPLLSLCSVLWQVISDPLVISQVMGTTAATAYSWGEVKTVYRPLAVPALSPRIHGQRKHDPGS